MGYVCLIPPPIQNESQPAPSDSIKYGLINYPHSARPAKTIMHHINTWLMNETEQTESSQCSAEAATGSPKRSSVCLLFSFSLIKERKGLGSKMYLYISVWLKLQIWGANTSGEKSRGIDLREKNPLFFKLEFNEFIKSAQSFFFCFCFFQINAICFRVKTQWELNDHKPTHVWQRLVCVPDWETERQLTECVRWTVAHIRSSFCTFFWITRAGSAYEQAKWLLRALTSDLCFESDQAYTIIMHVAYVEYMLDIQCPPYPHFLYLVSCPVPCLFAGITWLLCYLCFSRHQV